MKKISITVLFIFSFFYVKSKGFKTSVFVARNMSWVNSTSQTITFDKLNAGGSLNFEEEYFFHHCFSLRSGISYIKLNSSFVTPNPISTGGIPENYRRYRHIESLDFIAIPLLLKVRLSSEISNSVYFYTGTELEFVVKTKNFVYDEIGRLGNEPDRIEVIKRSNVGLKTGSGKSTNIAGVFGVGKNFKIENRVFFIETKFRFDLNSWKYITVNDIVNSSLKIKTKAFFLGLGMFF